MTNRTEKVLFHNRTLNHALRNYTFPADLGERQQKILKWIETLASGTLDEVKEVSLHGEFLRDIFQDALGYRSLVQGGGKAWEVDAERTISDGGGSADGALGFFTKKVSQKGKTKLQGRVIAPIELKGAKTDLDRRKAADAESPVEQGWRYANYTPNCKWVIVSNYRELRLYQTNKTPAYYERFWLANLDDLKEFQRFYYLLCRQNFLARTTDADATSAIDRLLTESDKAEKAITHELYEQYAEVRRRLVNHFLFTGAKDLPNRELVMIEKAQKTLDRILFIAFCEDRYLLPKETIKDAHDRQDPYHPRPIWDNFKKVFEWVDRGNDNPPIPGYNGGLFHPDPILDEQLTLPDPRCTDLKNLTDYDFETEISVDILGRIFEQSITDLEALRAEKTGQAYEQKTSKRKTQGVFYTPAWVTQYIVEVSLGRYLKQRQQEIQSQSASLSEIEFWQTYRDAVLRTVRVIDPACGPGAFLVAAFDYLMAEYERVNLELAALGGEQQDLSDVDRTILTQNLYGVDLSYESVEITKLSLWLKTAAPGKRLTDLDNNIKAGNSIVADTAIDPRAFNWQAEFPDVFAQGGFDLAIGNPPYVRQELLSPMKPYLQAQYETYDGVADLYTYFYEQGLNMLKPGGLLSYIVTNKWLRAGYGEPLRRFFVQHSIFEQIIDFGHAPIFEDADTFPCIVVARRETSSLTLPPSQDVQAEISPVTICPVPREKLPAINLTQYVQQEGYEVPWSRFTANAWSLESPAVDELMAKIKRIGVPLKDFAGVKPYRGILTGFNEAFLLDEATKNRLIQADPECTELIKPYVRGRDINRWSLVLQEEWIILLKSSANYSWSWSNNRDKAEDLFSQAFPSIYQHIKPFEKKLRERCDKGNFWWELRACAYYDFFEEPKIVYQVIQFLPQYALDTLGGYGNDKTYFLPSTDLCLLGWLNSPLLWWHNWRYFGHMKDEALNPANYKMETLPIAPPTDEIRSQVEPKVSRLIEITQANQTAHRDVLDWLCTMYRIDKPGQKLEDFASLSLTEFVAEIRKRFPKGRSKSSDPLGVAVFKAVREAYNDYAPTIQSRQAEALQLERIRHTV